MSGEPPREDQYSRVDYRRLVAWPQRIEREWPFLQQVLGAGAGRVLDLGCGTGEHSRFLASKGFEVVGLDSSPSMLAKAREAPLPGNLQFVEGDMTDVAAAVEGLFDGAICLGNALPHVTTVADFDRMIAGLRAKLRPGAPLLLQVLNYEKILGTKQRFLPLNFREGDEPGEELVFLRLMTPGIGGGIVFTPTTLRYRPNGTPPLDVISSKNVQLRAWQRHELQERLEAGGFGTVESFGTVGNVPYVPLESPDAVLVAR